MKMHTTTLFALFLLCAFTSHLPSTTAVDVTDIDGKAVAVFGKYYIVPFDREANGGVGGVEFITTGKENCPLTVIQISNPYSDGTPVRFSPKMTRSVIVKEEDYLAIELTFNLACTGATPSEWTAVLDEESDKVYVKISGYEHTIDGFFQIKSSAVDNGGYNLLFCPGGHNECFYLGVEVDDDRNRRLVVVTDNENDKNRLVVQFKKYSDELKATA